MRGKRLRHQLMFFVINDPYKRADYIRKNGVFHSCGNQVSFQPRKVPLYGELISVGDNVVIGSDVSFCTHDAMSSVFNRMGNKVPEKVGCIRIGNNCFIGAGAYLMYDTMIGDNSVVAAGAVVTCDVPPGSIVGGGTSQKHGKNRGYYREI